MLQETPDSQSQQNYQFSHLRSTITNTYFAVCELPTCLLLTVLFYAQHNTSQRVMLAIREELVSFPGVLVVAHLINKSWTNLR